MGRTRTTLGLVLLLGVGSVVVVLATSDAGTAARPVLHGAVESVIAVIAVLAALLAAVRANGTRRLDDFLLAGALMFLAASQIVFAMLPAAFSSTSQAWPWSQATGRLVGALLLAVAAVVPQITIARPRGLVVALSAGGAVVLALMGGVFL